MSYLLPLALTAVALAVTYATCIRPMRRNHGCHAGVAQPVDPAVDAEIRRLREQVQLLQRGLDLRTAEPASTDQPRR